MLNKADARKIVQRIDSLPLFLHAYAFHLNMRYGSILPNQLLDIASQHGLHGVKIHVLDGEEHSLGNASAEALQHFGQRAKSLNLELHVETSSSEAQYIDEAVRIAKQIAATSVRFYPRYEGHLSEVLRRVAADISYINARYWRSGLRFTIEQHEDLKSHELAALVKDSQLENLSILFDFANMINANEEPLAALNEMAPFVTEVHIKDALMIQEGTGMAHRACKSGQGDLPFKQLLARLICLGESSPQIRAYGLEEEVDYYAPPFRFTDEGHDLWIPWREMSETPMPTHGLQARLEQELRDAVEQINFVRKTLAELKQEAALALESGAVV